MYSLVSSDKIVSESKILIVDDTKTNRLMLSQFCRSAGFQHIEEACNGKEGLEKILSWRPDLVFMDMNMPQMDGLQVCQELKKQKLTDNMMIIMQTSIDKPEFKAQVFDAGATDFITKPLHDKEVIARAMAHLERLFLHRKMKFNYLRLHSELDEAAALQNILLPDEILIKHIKNDLDLDISHYYHPATELAGDYLSVRKLSGNRVALISVDVSGHGVTAALYAFSIHTLLDDKMLDSQKPSEILKILNAKLHGLMAHGKFATMFLGIIDLDNERLDYASAAAPSPILLTKENTTFLDTKGYLLGAQKNAPYETHSLSFARGDMIFLYSDALIETANNDGDFMVEQEIANILSANKSKDSSALLKTILSLFYTRYSKNLTDDLSMLIASYNSSHS